jgi:hypothetical protein
MVKLRQFLLNNGIYFDLILFALFLFGLMNDHIMFFLFLLFLGMPTFNSIYKPTNKARFPPPNTIAVVDKEEGIGFRLLLGRYGCEMEGLGFGGDVPKVAVETVLVEQGGGFDLFVVKEIELAGVDAN